MVREVRGTLFDGPVLHRTGNGVGDRRIERRTCLIVFCSALKTGLGRAGALHLFAKDVVAEQFLEVRLLEVDALELVIRAGDRLEWLPAES